MYIYIYVLYINIVCKRIQCVWCGGLIGPALGAAFLAQWPRWPLIGDSAGWNSHTYI